MANSFLQNRIERPPNKNLDASKQGKSIGVLIPFNDGDKLFKRSYITEDQVMSNLKLLILTRKGERYRHPTFGTDIYNVLFDQVDDEQSFIDRLKRELVSPIEEWMPYVIVKSLNVELNPEVGQQSDHAIRISMTIMISRTNINREVVIFISDTGTFNIITV